MTQRRLARSDTSLLRARPGRLDMRLARAQNRSTKKFDEIRVRRAYLISRALGSCRSKLGGLMLVGQPQKIELFRCRSART
jgi:hypothetical protein